LCAASSEATAQAQEILVRHPELTPKYGAQLATALLLQEDPEGAQRYVAAGNESVYQLFSQGTFSIAHKDYGTAFTQARALEERLAKEDEHPTLRGFNLVRLAFLAKYLGEQEWMEKSFATLHTLPCAAAIGDLFQEGSLTLENYFASR